MADVGGLDLAAATAVGSSSAALLPSRPEPCGPGVRADADRASTDDARALYTPTGRLLDVHYARRELNPVDGGKPPFRSSPGCSGHRMKSGRFSQQIRADLTTQEQEVRAKSIEYVGPGQGRYDSLGVYVGTGDYDVFQSPTGDQRTRATSGRIVPDGVRAGQGGRRGPEGACFIARGNLPVAAVRDDVRSHHQDRPVDLWNDLPDLRGGPQGRCAPSLVPSSPGGELVAAGAMGKPAGATPSANGSDRTISAMSSRATRGGPSRRSRCARPLRGHGPSSRKSRSTGISNIRASREAGSSFGSSGWRSLRLRLGEWFRPRNGSTVRLGLIARGSDTGRVGEGPVRRSAACAWRSMGGRAKERASICKRPDPGSAVLRDSRSDWREMAGRGRGSVSLRLHAPFSTRTRYAGDARPGSGTSSTSSRAEIRAVF